MGNQEQEIRVKIECPNPDCGYSYFPRVANPVTCPECRKRFSYSRRKAEEDKKEHG